MARTRARLYRLEPAGDVWASMKSQVLKRSVVIAGHKTSVSLEDAFWNGLKGIADNREMTLSELVAEIKSAHRGNLSSAIRVFVLRFYRDQLYGNEQLGRRLKRSRVPISDGH